MFYVFCLLDIVLTFNYWNGPTVLTPQLGVLELKKSVLYGCNPPIRHLSTTQRSLRESLRIAGNSEPKFCR